MTDTQIAAIGKLCEAYGLMYGAASMLAHVVGQKHDASDTQAKADKLWQDGMGSLMASLRDKKTQRGTRDQMEAGYFPSRAHCQCE